MSAVAEAPQRQQTGRDASPHEDPKGYLIARGWKPIGNPDWESCLWVDPTKPVTEEWTTEKAFAVNDEGVREQVMAFDGKSQTKKPVEQHVKHPAGDPVGFQHAVMLQMGRDRHKVLAQHKAQKVA